MVLAVIVVIRTIVGVGSATTLTLETVSFVLCLESDNRCTVLSCMRLLGRLRSARHMKWSAT
eukprot:6430359-Amphidinium_carterae.1